MRLEVERDERLAIGRIFRDEDKPLAILFRRFKVQHQAAAFYANRPGADFPFAAQSQDNLGSERPSLLHVAEVLAQVDVSQIELFPVVAAIAGVGNGGSLVEGRQVKAGRHGPLVSSGKPIVAARW